MSNEILVLVLGVGGTLMAAAFTLPIMKAYLAEEAAKNRASW